MKYKGLIFIIIGISLFLSSGCRRYPDDKRLLALSKIVSDRPEEVILSLDSIDKNFLSSRNRHYYDLLWIKARDKAYITHDSDSLILDVISYYKGNPDSNLYAEALYYGGRVYSDLGDNPTALKYFQESLINLKGNNGDPELKYRVLSQTGRLLSTLRLYEEAEEYVNEAVNVDKELDDTMKIVNDLQLLGEINIRNNRPNEAEKYLKEALLIGSELPCSSLAKTKVFMAEAKRLNKDLDSALIFIDKTVYEIYPESRNTALAYAAEIYRQANILDSAYKLANQIIRDESPNQKLIGFYILLSPEIRGLLPQDSIYDYINEYLYLLETQYDSNSSQLAITTQSKYNYNLHVRSKEKSEKNNRKLIFWITILVFVLLILIIIILLIKNHNKTILIQLRSANDKINLLKQQLDNENQNSNLKDNIPFSEKDLNKNSIEELRNQLRQQLIEIYNTGKEKIQIGENIYKSNIYKELRNYINEGKIINHDSDLWNEINSLIQDISPNFESRLRLLTGNNLTVNDYRTAMLLKLGITPSEMKILFGRAKNTISTRRELLGKKIYDKKINNEIIDGVIRIL